MKAAGSTDLRSPARGKLTSTHAGRTPTALLLSCVALCSAGSHAAEPAQAVPQDACAPEQTLQWRGGTVRLENDLFADTDRNYTNGVSLTLVSHDLEGRMRPDCLPAPVGLYTRFLSWADPAFRRDAGRGTASQNLALRLGQAMYTPEDETRTDLVLDDRPYAGLMYLGLGWNRRLHPQDTGYEMLDSRELTLGVIGPASLAEQSQDLVHGLRDMDRFRGWDHQLRNEPAIEFAIERKFKPYAEGAVQPGWANDVIGSYALRLGNIETSVSTGLEFRVGWNIPNDFGSYPIRPGGENRPPSATTRLRNSQPGAAGAPRPGTHAFVNVEAKAVAWDFSLDGNLFADSHQVSRRPWVAQAAAGISSQWLVGGRGIRLAVMRVWRTREFDEQDGHHAFGSVAVSLEF